MACVQGDLRLTHGQLSLVTALGSCIAKVMCLAVLCGIVFASAVQGQDMTAEDAYKSGTLDAERKERGVLPSELAAESLAEDKGYLDGSVPLSSMVESVRQYGRTDVDMLPIDLIARVNYWDVRDGCIFVQDGFNGSYIEASATIFETHPSVRPGTQVRLLGELVLQGHYFRCDRIDLLDELEPVSPLPLKLDRQTVGTHWSERVITSGKVMEVARYGERWLAVLESEGCSFVVQRHDREGQLDWQSLIDCEVEVVGVLACDLDFTRTPYRYRVFVSEFDEPLKLISKADKKSDSKSRLLSSIEDLRRLNAASDQIYQMSGQVTSVDPSKGLLVRLDGVEQYIESEIAASENLGHEVDLYFRCDGANQFRSVSVDAREKREIPSPVSMSAGEVVVEHLPFRASVRGKLVSKSSEALLRKLVLQDGESSFCVEFYAEDETWLVMGLDTAGEISVTGMLVVADGESDTGAKGLKGDPPPKFLVRASGVDAIEVRSRDWQLSRQAVVTTLSVAAGVFALGTLLFSVLWFRVKRADRRNKELTAQLVESQKMDALGRLASGVAHDFNNLLTGISSNLQLVEAGAKASADSNEAEQQSQCLASAQRCTRQATKLVRSLLGFARQADLELKTGDVNSAIDDVATMLRSSVGPNIQIQLDLQQDLPLCRFDFAQMEQVLLNLCFNARDAIHNASYKKACSIRLETEEQQLEGQGQVVQIRVIDDGEGMDQETREKIFEPFFTTKPVGHGTGLGLPMAYGIISQHGGTLKCISEKGIGTRFEITLPVAIPGESSTVPAGPTEVFLGNSVDGARVLVVDDDAEVLRVAKLSLEALGYVSVAVSGGQQALDLLAEKAGFDAVILDLQMPELSGLGTYKQIRQIRPDLPVIICSGHIVDLHRLRDDSGNPPNGCLEKPFELAELRSKLETVLVSSKLSLVAK